MKKVMRLRGGRGANSGEVMNILSTDGDALVDASRLIGAAVMPMFIFLLSIIIGLVTAGWPTLVGNMAVFFSGAGFIVFGKLMIRYRTEGANLTGERLELMTETLSSMRLIKMFNWEASFMKRIMSVRYKESAAYAKFNFVLSFIFGINTIIPTLATIITFTIINTFDMEQPSPENTFLLIAVWNVLASQLRLLPIGLQSVANYKAAFTRIDAFLKEEELSPYVTKTDDGTIEMASVTLKWNNSDESEALKEVSIKVNQGDTCVLTGHVGAGKTSVLSALTNQMYLTSGHVSIDDNVSIAL